MKEGKKGFVSNLESVIELVQTLAVVRSQTCGINEKMLYNTNRAIFFHQYFILFNMCISLFGSR